MNPELQHRVLNRLADTGVADEPWALAIVAALDGPAELDSFIDQTGKRKMPAPPGAAEIGARPDPPGVHVASLTVEGFRGIGNPVTLTFPPGPGLTLVVGRNGSGKSSLAEGLELLLTDSNYRWADRPKAWQDGWRNLHQPQRVSLRAELLVEGQGALTVSREWKTGVLGDSESTVTKAGRASGSFDSHPWSAQLATFRPFLSYNELGSLLEDGPSKLYDALSSVLGLDELVEVQATLTGARKSRQTIVDTAKTGAKSVADQIAALTSMANDERLTLAAGALKWTRLDVPCLERLVAGTHAGDRSELALLERIRALPVPDVNAILEAADALRRAEQACAKFAGTSVERSRERAQLLEDAVRYHEKHKDAACPVCGTANVLSRSWQARTTAEIAALHEEAKAYQAAESNRTERLREAQRFLGPAPPVLAQAVNLGLPALAEIRRQWADWSKGRDLQTAPASAAHLADHAAAFADAVTALIDDADAEWKKRQDQWQPIAAGIAEWLPRARAARRAAPRIDELKQAENWWKEASGEIRDERFTPVADRAVSIWRELRLQSNVDLGGIVLEGTAQRRKVALRVTVDGTPAEALGVMSQGELHALALSLFLPRATLPESPFRFIWIDDPVQSMDPARVEGLAKALGDTARTRQVVVFTHDDRLPEAVRRLGIPATGFAVTRRANSVVEVRAIQDPVSAHLADARSLALTRDLPAEVASRVIPGFCRAAVEAACMETVRRRRLGRGELHQSVEDLLEGNARPHPLMALALFDDEQRTNDVLPRLNKIGKGYADAFRACKAGAHTSHDGDLDDLIAHTERLARFVLKECR